MAPALAGLLAMPIYEYQCVGCRRSFEVLVAITKRDAIPCCPDCGSTDTRRKVSLFAARSSSADGTSETIGHSACPRCGRGPCSCCAGH